VVFFNYTTMQMTAKIVYYGPGLCGKTTNLQAIHDKTASKSRGEMVSLETETDRTLFFDLLPLDVGVIGGMRVRLQLYTVPGQVFYNATRKLVLKGVDGVVFVADSQVAAQDTNVESFNNLKANIAELGLTLEQLPLVFQYNKRDIRNIQPVEVLNDTLNPGGAPFYEAAALHGIGVFETLKAISRLAISSVRKKVGPDPSGRPAMVSVQTAGVVPGAVQPAAVVPATAAPDADESPLDVELPPVAPPSDSAGDASSPLEALVPDAAAEDVRVEFAEEVTGEHSRVRPVRTKAQVDIQKELEGLRALTTAAPAKPAPAPAPSFEMERRLKDVLVREEQARQDVRRKASLEVPGHLLKEFSAMKIHLAFGEDGQEEVVRDAVTVKLLGNRRLERLTLHIELEIRGKDQRPGRGD
jgi:mutual gliding-motility protein MglA